MSSTHLQDDLEVLARETAALTRSVAALDDVAARQATLCPGWSRAHVVTHVARNADALGNLVHWAVTGERTQAYASAQARDADIEAGAGRTAAELLADHERAAADFARRAEGLQGPAAEAEVVTRAGAGVRGAQIPAMRLIEVVFHHVDLQVGYTFADADAGFVERSLRRAVRRVRSDQVPLDLTITTTEGDEWVLGDGRAQVRGTRSQVLLWLARGVDDLQHDAPLPVPPPWG